ncbi:hypothetical protein UFOVP699_160 [uncultured Caudovirales phage]|uniref:Uncharacterized protein n=1 Tax=uncultured Caudovirales phage TaxID=2100421 RepID=A0A6J5NW26_9CAUD|nr:hypothetical protein UFOVP699_160 [uncultured Caudovirales phage]
MKTVNSIWEVLDGEGTFKGIKTDFGNNCMLFEISQDTDDGTYPTVASYTRDANALDDEGASHFLNKLTRKKNKLEIDFEGVKIIRESKWDNEAILEFKEPVEILFAYIGETPVVRDVKKIKGTFTHDWFWTKNGRQTRIANGYEIWFIVESYLE